MTCPYCLDDGFYVVNLMLVRGHLVGETRICTCDAPHPNGMSDHDLFTRKLPNTPNCGENIE